MTISLLIQSQIYCLSSIKSHYYDIQTTYAFEATLTVKEVPALQSGISAQIKFVEGICLPVEILRCVLTPCLGGVQLLLILVSPLQAQLQARERYFVEQPPFAILKLLLKEEGLPWQIQCQDSQSGVIPFFRQSAQTFAEAVVSLLKSTQWGQLFSMRADQVVWQVGALQALVGTQPEFELPVTSGEWGGQFGKHAYAVSRDTHGSLMFGSDALYWPVGTRIQWQGKQYAIVRIDLTLTDNSATLGGAPTPGRGGVKTQAVLLEKLQAFFLKQPLAAQGWVMATIEGKEVGSAVRTEGGYRASMQNDCLLKSKGCRSPNLVRLHPFMNQEEGFHWPLHEGTTVITAFCDDETLPVIVGPVLSEHVEPKVTHQNAKTHAFTTPGGSHWQVDEEENWLQFGTPRGEQRFSFEQTDIVLEAKESAIIQQIETAYSVCAGDNLVWEAGKELTCQVVTEWMSESDTQKIEGQTCHFTADKEIRWFAEATCEWNIQGMCRLQFKQANWQALQRLDYQCEGAMRIRTKTFSAQTPTNLSLHAGQSMIKLSMGGIRFSGGNCILQAPIIEIKPGCKTVIKMK